MTLSLRQRVLLLVAVVNVAVFAVGLWVLNDRLETERREARAEFEANQEKLSELIDYIIQQALVSSGELRAGPILSRSIWGYCQDAVIVGARWDRRPDGTIQPLGSFLNPLGNSHRAADFDMPGVLASIEGVVKSGVETPFREGMTIPVIDRDGSVWGGCWFVLPPLEVTSGSFLLLLPWFLLSTLLLTLGNFAILRRFVLDPVSQLADGARRVSSGDLSVRLEVPARRDELAELIRVFNAMTSQVQGYNERLAQDVAQATAQVREAEQAAMTQRRLAAMGELAAGIAHEINNPLAGLMNAAETLQRRDLPEEKQAQYGGLLRDGLERIRGTVSKLLRFTPRPVERMPINLLIPVADAVALVGHRVRKLDVSLKLFWEDVELVDEDRIAAESAHVPPVLGEQNELGQAVLNLLVNALDALEERPEGRAIEVRLRREGKELCLRVSDNGPGMAEDALASASDLFFSTKEVGRGSGLGLSIVHAVVTNHDGRVSLQSAPGEGFRATIRLPIHELGRELRRDA